MSSLLSLPSWLFSGELWCVEDSGIARCHSTRAEGDRGLDQGTLDVLDQGTLDVIRLESNAEEDRMGPISGWPMSHSLSSDMSGR